MVTVTVRGPHPRNMLNIHENWTRLVAIPRLTWMVFMYGFSSSLTCWIHQKKVGGKSARKSAVDGFSHGFSTPPKILAWKWNFKHCWFESWSSIQFQRKKSPWSFPGAVYQSIWVTNSKNKRDFHPPPPPQFWSTTYILRWPPGWVFCLPHLPLTGCWENSFTSYQFLHPPNLCCHHSSWLR